MSTVFSKALDNIQNRNVRSTSRNVDVIKNLFGSSTTMDEKNALKLSAYFSGVQMISNNIACLEPDILQYGSDGERTKRNDFYLRDLLRFRPKQHLSGYKFKKFMILSMLTRGNAYAVISKNLDNEVTELTPESPSDVDVLKNEDTGQIFYDIDGYKKKHRADEVLHYFNFTKNGYTGQSYIEAGARQAFASHLSVQEFNKRFFENNSFLGGILQTDQSLGSNKEVVDKAKSKIREEWDQNNAGTSNAGNIAILEGDFSFEKMNMSLKDSQLIERSEFTVKDIARFLNIPLSMLGVKNANSYNSIEADSIQYLKNCIKPIIKIMEQENRNKLLTEKQKSNGYEIKYDPEELEMTLLKDKAEALKQLVLSTILSPDEARDKMNLENKGGDADKLQIQKNMETLD